MSLVLATLLAAFEPPAWLFGFALIAAVVAPILISRALASLWRTPDMTWRYFWILFAMSATAVLLIAPSEDAEGNISLFRKPRLGVDLKGGVILVYQVREQLDGESRPIPVDIAKVSSDIGVRLNQTGMEDIVVRPYGEKQVEIIVPDVDQTGIEQIKKKIETAGALEFRIVCNRRDHTEHMERAREKAESPSELERRGTLVTDTQGQPLARWVTVDRDVETQGIRPLKLDVSRYLVRDSITGRVLDLNQFLPTEEQYWFEKEMKERGITDIDVLVAVDDGQNVTGDDLLGVRSGFDSVMRPQVEFSLIGGSAARFGALTGANRPDGSFRRQLGIVMDGRLITAPDLENRISDNGVIHGNFTKEEVEFYVSILRAGRLSATIEPNPISENEIGPVLGLSTIRQGATAIGVSLIAVLVFTLLYYRFAGVVACAALLGNLAMTLALMIFLSAPLTLPGLAGLVLTVGMSVDANVLIFERIREELDRGAGLRMAIRNGFARATMTIVDANLTTLITAVVLYVIGTDQIKGFAVTLVLGILMSMFTAIYCARAVFEVAERRRWITKLSMARALGNTAIDFISFQKLAATVSLVLIVIGLVAVVGRGKSGLLDIDFNGGVSVQMLMDGQGQTDEQMRERLNKALEGQDYTLTRLDVDGQPANTAWKVDTSQEDVDDLKATLKKEFQLASYNVKIDDIREVKAAANGSPSTTPAKAEKGPSPKPSDSPASSSSPKKDAPKKEDAPKEDAPKEDAPKKEAPKEEAPKEEAPKKEAPQEEASKEDGSNAPAPGDCDYDPILAEQEDSAEAEPAAQTPVEPSPPATPAPAGDTAAAAPEADTAVRTEALLTFNYKVQEAVIRDRLIELAEQLGQPAPVMSLTIGEDDPNWRPGMAAPYAKWKIALAMDGTQAQPLLDSLRQQMASEPVWLASNKIGGKVASDMTRQALMALFASLVGIVAYIWFRFQRMIYGLAAVVALVHDVLITLGAIALSAYLAGVLGFLKVEEFKISLPVVAAFLTIIGYSLNDTIVVFDRIREVKGKTPLLTGDIINTSINQTLSRTLLTSLTTLIVVAILYFIGGPGIHSFAFALLVGVIVGTYSSIFVASPALLWMTKHWQEG